VHRLIWRGCSQVVIGVASSGPGLHFDIRCLCPFSNIFTLLLLKGFGLLRRSAQITLFIGRLTHI